MEYMILAFVWVLNFAISIWNAYAVGKVWVETKHAGGWYRIVAWAGAVMSASGFSWCYMIFLAITGKYFEWITAEQFSITIQLGYILLIPGILLSGYVITLDSWAEAYRNRDLASMGVAGWNTFASIYNTYSAIQDFGPAFRNVTSFFSGSSSSSDDKDSSKEGIVLALVLLAIAGGIVTTAVIIKKVAGSTPLPEYMRGEVAR